MIRMFNVGFVKVPVTLANFTDDIQRIIENAMDDAGCNEESFCKVRGTDFVDSETGAVLASLVSVDAKEKKVVLTVSDGTVTLDLE